MDVGIIFGSGLGRIANPINISGEVPYSNIPGFKPTTIANHRGTLLFGKIGSRNIVCMNGRLHFYEGYSQQDITFPLKVMIALGIKTLMISNISGGLNPNYQAGDLCVLTDYMNCMFTNPLIGPNDEKVGPRYHDMKEPFNIKLRKLVEKYAREFDVQLHPSLYASVMGPNYETPAEIRMFRKWGADLIGMSTIPETIVANHAGVRTIALSLVSNECFAECLRPITQKALLDNANKGSEYISKLFSSVIQDKEF